MGAFTGSPTGSVQYNLQTGATQGGVAFHDRLHCRRFAYTHGAGAGTGVVNLVSLPAGFVTIYPDLCRLVTSEMATGADLHLGHRAYTEPDGDAVIEDDNAFADNVDGGAAQDVAWPLPAVGFFEANVRSSTIGGLTIFCTIDTGNIEDTDTINGYVVWGDSA